MALIDNLVGYWKLDEASSNADDSHGSNTLLQNGSVGTTTGKLNGARGTFGEYPGTYFYHASNSDLTVGDEDFTVAVWVKTGSSTGNQHCVGEYVFNSSGGGWTLLTSNDNSGKMRFLAKYNSGTLDVADSTTFGSVADNNWHHVVAWHDSVNNQIGIAIDGGSANTTSYSAGVGSNSIDFEVGWNLALGSLVDARWQGYIDELGFWKRVLTSQERTDLYNGGAGLAYPFTTPKGIILPRRHRRVANLVRM